MKTLGAQQNWKKDVYIFITLTQFWYIMKVKGTSCKKSAMPLRGGHLNPQLSKNSSTLLHGPWYTTTPSDSRMMSSKSWKVSGAGCNNDTRMVPSSTCTIWLKQLIIWNVVELSNPVEISSMNNAALGPTSISPTTQNTQQNTHTHIHAHCDSYQHLEHFMWT
jgi:hypothetical protein